jgi:hypothetical protein
MTILGVTAIVAATVITIVVFTIGRHRGANAPDMLVSVPVVQCPTTLGGSSQQPRNLPGEVTVKVPITFARNVSVFEDSLGIMSLIGPGDWICSGTYGIDGVGGLSVYPPTATAASQEAIVGYQTSACNGCGLQLACPLFPNARALLAQGGGPVCSASGTPGQITRRLRSDVVEFQDPAKIKGVGAPSGGSYPALGVITFGEGPLNAASRVTCTLPSRDRSLCEAALDRYLEHFGVSVQH